MQQQSSNHPSVCVKVCVLLCVFLGYTTLICCHICVSWLLRDMAGQAPCVCLSVCVSVCVTGEAMVRKGMWQQSHIQGPPPTGPQGLDYTILHYTHSHRHIWTRTHAIYRGGTGVLCLVSHVFVTTAPPPSFCNNSTPCIFSLFLQIPADFKTNSARKTHKWNKYKHSKTLTGMKIKERRRHFSFFPKEMSLELNEQASVASKLHWVCLHALVLTVCASAVCSDQTHWCVIGFPLSWWPLRLECLSWWRTGGGRIDDNVLQTTHTHIHIHTENTLCKWHKCVERLLFSLCICMRVCVCVCLCVRLHTCARLSLPLLSCL